MADIISFVLEKVAAPVVSGGLGVGATIWRMTASLSSRLADVEQAWKHFKDDEYPRDRQDLVTALNNALRPLRADIESVQTEMRKESRERADVRRVLASLNERLLVIERRVAVCEKDVETLDAQWRQFAKEQGEQWQDMVRTLGQLEGWMKARSASTSSDQYPPTK